MRTPETSAPGLGRSCRDYLGRYYTVDVVSSLLVSMMDTSRANRILDLGSGEGSLSLAASERWKKAKIISMDIDKNSNIQQSQHFVGDVLSYELPRALGLKEGCIDLAVCNPPYIKAKWKSDFAKVAETIGISNYSSFHKICSAEIIFLAQMIRMLKNGGEAGIILPDGVLTADKFMQFREFLLKEHCVKKIIELPRNVFKSTEAKTHIVIFNKGTQKENYEIELRSFINDSEISYPLYVRGEDAIERLDFSYHDSKRKSSKNINTTLHLVAEVFRGKHSSVEVKTSKYPTVHTTNIIGFNTNLKLGGDEKLLLKNGIGVVVAKPGDILIARVGRNFSQKIAIVESGYAIVSDCLFVIRCSKKNVGKKVFNYLCSNNGQNSLNNIAYGVAAKQISMKQILNFEMEIK